METWHKNAFQPWTQTEQFTGNQHTLTDYLSKRHAYNPTSHKATMVRTLTRRSQIVCHSDHRLTDKVKLSLDRWLPQGFSKRQSQTAVLLRTPAGNPYNLFQSNNSLNTQTEASKKQRYLKRTVQVCIE